MPASSSAATSAAISRVTAALDAIRAGRMVIMVDDEDRENEGDLVLAADLVPPEAINFMARHRRGLICLAMDGSLIDRLELPMMVRDNQASLGTAFTVSIEARHGVSTGISARDRATTIRPLAQQRGQCVARQIGLVLRGLRLLLGARGKERLEDGEQLAIMRRARNRIGKTWITRQERLAYCPRKRREGCVVPATHTHPAILSRIDAVERAETTLLGVESHPVDTAVTRVQEVHRGREDA